MTTRRRSVLQEQVLARVPRGLRKLRANCARLIAEIEGIQRVVDGLPVEPFREPRSELDLSGKGANTLLNLHADLLTSWAQHIAFSTRFRMRALEKAALLQAAELQLLAAMTLVRAHVEAAGLAALALRTLIRCGTSADTKRLEELIPQTLFGSGTALHAERNEVAQALCGLTEGHPYRVGHGIDALDLLHKEFSGAEENRELFKLHYSVLCQFAHPTMRTSKRFVRRADPIGTHAMGGWTIEYGPDEDAIEEIPMALGMLANSMHSGHAYSELLRCFRFVEEKDGMYMEPPSRVDHRRVWDTLLVGPGPRPGTRRGRATRPRP